MQKIKLAPAKTHEGRHVSIEDKIYDLTDYIGTDDRFDPYILQEGIDQLNDKQKKVLCLLTYQFGWEIPIGIKQFYETISIIEENF